MKLDVPLITQEKGTDDCGLACLAMVLNFHNVQKSVDELKESLQVYEGIGVYAPQLGKYLVENGFKADIVTINPHLFTKKMEDKSEQELMKYLQGDSDSRKSFREFMEAGGKITVKVPSVEDIKEEINNNRPLIALMTEHFLLCQEPEFDFHFNVITGIDEEFIYVNDPLYDHRGGKHKYKISEYLYAIYSTAYFDTDNASLLKIKP